MHTINVSQMFEVLKNFWLAETTHEGDSPRMVPLFISYPGVGKTSTCRRFCAWLNETTESEWVLYDYSVLQSTPEDMRGAVSFVDLEDNLRVTSNCPPQNFPLEGYPQSAGGKNVFIFLDEVKTAPTLMQQLAACIVDGRVGDYKIDKTRTFVVLASNPDDTLGTFETPENLKNRVCEIHIKADPSEWLPWAFERHLHPYVTSFIQIFPNLLSHPKPQTSHGFPSPRVWENVSMFLDGRELDLSMPEFFFTPVMVGYLGPAVAHEFVTHCVTAGSKLNPRLVFEGKYSELPTKVSDSITLLDVCLYQVDWWIEQLQTNKELDVSDYINRFFRWMDTELDTSLVLNRMSLRSEEQRKALAEYLYSNPDTGQSREIYSKLCAQTLVPKTQD